MERNQNASKKTNPTAQKNMAFLTKRAYALELESMIEGAKISSINSIYFSQHNGHMDSRNNGNFHLL